MRDTARECNAARENLLRNATYQASKQPTWVLFCDGISDVHVTFTLYTGSYTERPYYRATLPRSGWDDPIDYELAALMLLVQI